MTAHRHLLISEYRLRGANDGDTRMTLELYNELGHPDWQISQLVATTSHARVIMDSGAVVAELNDEGVVTRVFVADAAYDASPLASMADA